MRRLIATRPTFRSARSRDRGPGARRRRGQSGALANQAVPQTLEFVELFGSVILVAAKTVTDRRKLRRVSDDRILDAAAAEFAARGFDGASMAAIATRAGTHKPT